MKSFPRETVYGVLDLPITYRLQRSSREATRSILARLTFGRNAWSLTLLRYVKYCQEEIAPVARAILEANESSKSSSDLVAVNKKYANTRFNGVASAVLANDF